MFKFSIFLTTITLIFSNFISSWLMETANPLGFHQEQLFILASKGTAVPVGFHGNSCFSYFHRGKLFFLDSIMNSCLFRLPLGTAVCLDFKWEKLFLLASTMNSSLVWFPPGTIVLSWLPFGTAVPLGLPTEQLFLSTSNRKSFFSWVLKWKLSLLAFTGNSCLFWLPQRSAVFPWFPPGTAVPLSKQRDQLILLASPINSFSFLLSPERSVQIAHKMF